VRPKPKHRNVPAWTLALTADRPFNGQPVTWEISATVCGSGHASKTVAIFVEDAHFRVVHNGQEPAIHPRKSNARSPAGAHRRCSRMSDRRTVNKSSHCPKCSVTVQKPWHT